MRIALADDHALFRAGLRSTLAEAFEDPVEVSEAKDFDELTALLASDRDFDLVLCDLRMPGMDPRGGVSEVAECCLETPLVMISASEDPTDACSSIEQGARGYILKSESLAVLQRAIELVLAGGTYVPASILLSQHHAAATMRPKAGAAPGATGPAGRIPMLSARQRAVFERLADGKPNKLIARELGIAEGTVKAQLRAVFRKLGVRNRTQAALYAAEILGYGDTAEVLGTGPDERAAGPQLSPMDAKPLSFEPAKGATLKIITSRR